MNLNTELPHSSADRSTPLSWYAIRTRPNHEKTTTSHLTHKGFEPYFPTYRPKRRASPGKSDAERPLFPGYVFCRFDVKKRLPIITIPGVVSILGFGNQPAPIPDDEIAAVKGALRSGLPAEPCPFLTEGQRIRIERGSLEGVEGKLLKKKNECRLVISVPMLQRSISVEIDRDSISTL